MAAQLRIDAVRVSWLDDCGWLGCRAVAEVSYPVDSNGNRRIETLTSGGLWGIDEPSADYKAEIEREQLDDLRDHLIAFGIDVDPILTVRVRKP